MDYVVKQIFKESIQGVALNDFVTRWNDILCYPMMSLSRDNKAIGLLDTGLFVAQESYKGVTLEYFEFVFDELEQLDDSEYDYLA